jgi:hypothetical protein
MDAGSIVRSSSLELALYVVLHHPQAARGDRGEAPAERV